MNKLLLLCLTLIAVTGEAQTSVYHPFPDSNAVWNEEGIGNFGGITLWYHWQQRYFINGDTTVVNTYHKIYEQRVDDYPSFAVPWCFYTIPGIPHPYYYGAIRQDIIQKKIYFLPSGNSNDTLLYDFNLNLGDTLPPSYNHQTTLIVTHIDSMFDGNSYRNRFSLSSPFANAVSIMEGIGSSWGLFWSLDPPFEAMNTLHCFKQNGSTLYTDSCSFACDMATNINSIEEYHNLIHISPNPFHSTSIFILENDFKNAELNIYNTLGVQVRHKIIISQSTIIDRDDLQDGTYFYQVISDQRRVTTGRLIID